MGDLVDDGDHHLVDKFVLVASELAEEADRA